MKTFKTILITVVILALFGGGVYVYFKFFTGEIADQEGNLQYISGRLPVYDEVYEIRATILGSPSGVVRQKTATTGRIGALDGLMMGFISGSQQSGKVLLRVKVDDWKEVSGKQHEIAAQILNADSPIIIKAIDLKANVLYPEDIVTFRCRLEAEALSASKKTETLSDRVLTHEIDSCKMLTPTLGEREIEIIEE